MVYKFQLANDEIIDILDLKSISPRRTDYSLTPGIFGMTELIKTFEFILTNIVNVSIRIDDTRLKSKLNINQTLIFT